MGKNLTPPSRSDFERLLIDGDTYDAFSFLHDFVSIQSPDLRRDTLILLMDLKNLQRENLTGKTTDADVKFRRLIMGFVDIIDTLQSNQLLEKNELITNQSTSLIEVEIDCPTLLRISVQQYLIYFNEFVKVAKGEDISFEVQKIDSGLSISLVNQKSVPLTQIQQWLDEYIGLLKQDEDNLEFIIKEDTNQKNLDILIADLRNQIAHLKNSIEILKLKNMFLKQETDFIKSLNSQETLRIGPENQLTNSEKIKKLIQTGKTRKALEMLSTVIDTESDEYNEILAHFARLSTIDLQYRLGQIDEAYKNQEYNRVNTAILEFVKFHKEVFKKSPPTP